MGRVKFSGTAFKLCEISRLPVIFNNSANIFEEEQIEVLQTAGSLFRRYYHNSNKIKMVDTETLFDLLQMEMVHFIHNSKGISKNEANTKLEQMGFRVGQSLIEKFTKDSPRFKEELDIMKYLCKDFWVLLYNKQVDNLRTNHQGVYVLVDSEFKLLNRIGPSRQHIGECQKYVAYPCGLIRGALAGLGKASFVTADINDMPSVKFQVEIQKN